MDLHQFGLRPLRIADRPFIDSILCSKETMLSAYAFVSHYIWHDIFHFHWGIIDDYLCLFAHYNDYIYMPIPPTSLSSPPRREDKGEGERFSKIMRKVFTIMELVNHNKAVSRIENIDERQIGSFTSSGYDIRPGEPEYLYTREDLASLKGELYKSKRAMCNNFEKHYRYRYEPFQASFVNGCIRLYDEWKREKGKKFDDPIYHALLEDSSRAHKQAVKHYTSLHVTGRVVRINEQVEGYIFGSERGGDIFYILMEITNPDIKGLAQFIFREFCREMEGYTYINTLSDSGLENLRKVKRSYRPCKIIPSYIAYQA